MIQKNQIDRIQKVRNDIEAFFKDLVFQEEGHLYLLNGIALSVSVTTFIKKYVILFDREKRSFSTSKQLGITQDQIKKEWDEITNIACVGGSQTHFFAEEKMRGKKVKANTPKELAVEAFFKELPDHIIPFIYEMPLCHFKAKIAGTPDVLFYDTLTDTIFIGDYKTNKDIYKNFNGQMMLGPFCYLLDMPINHYILQLNMYQLFLQQIEGIKVSGRILIWLKEDGSYQLESLPDVTNILKYEL
jgi:hypothetical protein